MLKRVSEVNFYNEVKQKLITTLNMLADRKISEQHKIQEFKDKKLGLSQRSQSRKLIEAAECKESMIDPIMSSIGRISISEEEEWEEEG